MERRLPAALWVTLIGGVVLLIGWWLLVREMTPHGGYRALGLAGQARGLALSAMMVGSMLLVRDVIARGPLRTILLAVAIAYGLVQVFVFAVQLWLSAGSAGGGMSERWYMQASAWVGPVVRTAAIAAIAAIGVRRDRPATLVGLALVLTVAVLRDPIPPLIAPLVGVLPNLASSVLLVHIGLSVVIAGGVIALARLGAGGVGLGWRPAQGGLERAATAMAWRIGMTVSVVPLVFLAAETRSMGMVKLVMIGVPLASAVAGAVSVVGLLDASRADAEGAPRLRLATAAYAAAIGAALDLMVGLIMFATEEWIPVATDLGGVLRYTMPTIALTGTLAFVSALGAITTRVPSGVQRDGLVTVGIALGAVTGGGIWLQRSVGGETSPSGLIALSLVISVIAIATTVALVSMTRRIAAALGGAPSVPVAVARGVG